ncbi:hypothetical protein [Xanthomonas sacchari]|uniref:hypothetical protein n=1 Tax=Xanthomonas sacchari TaxID=56458 RepID=UPI002257DE1A|nr:hypothetical protein [Xanthomonas sacchari]MCW0370243.1 hypothetical protein [Xanthomonas sacchari]
MATRYAKQTGKNWPRWPVMEPLDAVAKFRRAPRWSASHHYHYLPSLKRAARPVLGQLRMIEAAIRMTVQMEATLSAWRTAA